MSNFQTLYSVTSKNRTPVGLAKKFVIGSFRKLSDQSTIININCFIVRHDENYTKLVKFLKKKQNYWTFTILNLIITSN
jgi:hypothetical protein